MKFNPQQTKIYRLLHERGDSGIKCFEFAPLLNITQQNARIGEMREKLGCVCKNTRGNVRPECFAHEHIVNDGGTTYLVRPHTYQPSFI